MTKPPFTAPCNHCGLCCQREICEVGALAFPHAVAPCPGLLERDGLHLCGLVLLERAARVAPLMQSVLGIGTGCSMPDEDTTEEQIDAYDAFATLEVKRIHGLLPQL